jgi:REP element-mobilizing transposase RayT
MARRPPRKLRKGQQAELVFRTHGGRRAGAGRRPKGQRAGVSHLRRPEHQRRYPLHVTVKLLPIARTLRTKKLVQAARGALAAGCNRFGFRLVEFSVEHDHYHFIAEAEDRRALSRGMQGLTIRIAKALNRALTRAGRVFADRYHARALRSPREIREAVAYVLRNEAKHAFQRGDVLPAGWVDPFSSGPHFTGWKPLQPHRQERARTPESWAMGPPATTPARTWLLQTGWRRHGLLERDAIPGVRRRFRKDGSYRIEVSR